MKYIKLTILGISSLAFIGCNEVPQLPQPHVPQNRSNFVQTPDTNATKPKDTNQATKPITIPKPPKKNIKLKKVQDDNFSPEYMYPESKKPVVKKVAKKSTPSTTKMTQQECINLIGQERFDRYVQMLGSIDGAIKRCMMIKASQS
jgi:hypothetical protein